MTRLDRGLLRALAEWDPGDEPITSLYLTVDGRRFPRRSEYELRLDELLRGAREQARDFGERAARSVERDAEAISGFVRDGFDRGDTRGIAVFSSRGAGLWESVLVPRPVRDRAVVAPQADLLPLEALLETYRPSCAALVDFEKARVFLVEMGSIEEVAGFSDDVPGRHDQGGWAQMRMQRHVDDHRSRHLRRVAEELFALWRRRRFEQLVLAGPAEAHGALEPFLHDYLRRRLRGNLTLPMTATTADLLEGVLRIEEDVERDRERSAIDRVARAAAAEDHGVAGLDATLEALAEGRVGELVVAIDLHHVGAACPTCGRLTTGGRTCPRCGGAMDRVPDVVEAAVAAAVRAGASVETVVDSGLGELGGIGAILRF